jgi:hypothetical protein
MATRSKAGRPPAAPGKKKLVLLALGAVATAILAGLWIAAAD